MRDDNKYKLDGINMDFGILPSDKDYLWWQNV